RADAEGRTHDDNGADHGAAASRFTAGGTRLHQSSSRSCASARSWPTLALSITTTPWRSVTTSCGIESPKRVWNAGICARLVKESIGQSIPRPDAYFFASPAVLSPERKSSATSSSAGAFSFSTPTSFGAKTRQGGHQPAPMYITTYFGRASVFSCALRPVDA